MNSKAAASSPKQQKKRNLFISRVTPGLDRSSDLAPLEPLLLPERTGTAEQRQQYLKEVSQLKENTCLLERGADLFGTEPAFALPPLKPKGKEVAPVVKRLYKRPLHLDSLEASLRLPRLVPTEPRRKSPQTQGSEEWHVMLVPEALAEISVDELVGRLVSVVELGIDVGTAKGAVNAVKGPKGKAVSLTTRKTRLEAAMLVRHMRDRGVAVRFSSVPTKDASWEARATRVRKVAQGSIGQQRKDLFHLADTCKGMRVRTWDSSFNEDFDYDIAICPQDPVATVLSPREKVVVKEEEKPEKEKRAVKAFGKNCNWDRILDHVGRPAKKADDGWDFAAGLVMNNVTGNLTLSAKSACRMIRIFLFGKVGNENLKRDSKNDIYYETIGSKEMVRQLYDVWSRLDIDRSGKVDMHEFRMFASVRMREKIVSDQQQLQQQQQPPEKAPVDVDAFVQKLCNKAESMLLKSKPFFTIEDLLHIVWPCAGIQELRTMKAWCRDLCKADAIQKVPTPTLLGPEDVEALTSLFNYFDQDGDGSISLGELKDAGLLTEDQYDDYLRDWDKNGDGRFDLTEFCEMMCPTGFRAFATSKVGSLPGGRRVLYDEDMKGWRAETSENQFDGGWLA